MTTPSPNVAHLRWSSHAQSLQSVFQDLYSQQALVDVTLACRGGSVKAHKVILSAVSPYFRRLFAESSCRHPIVILRDVDVVMVERLLNYVYGSDVQVTEMAWRTLCDTAQILGMSESLFVKPEQVNPASEGQTLGCEFLTPKDNHHSKLVIDQQQKRNSIVKCEENQELEHTRAAKRTLPLAKESEAVGDRTADESTDAMRKPSEVNGEEDESFSEEDYETTKERSAATEEPLSQKRKIGAKEEPVLRNAKHRRKPFKRTRKEIQRVPMDLSKISNEDSASQAIATPLPESPVPLLIKPEVDLDTKSDDGDERENTESESLLNATAEHYPFSVLDEQVSGSLVVQAICPFCFKDCKRTAELRAHIRAHTGEKPFRCDICNAPFARSAHLKRHRRVHTGERPFECLRCQKAFSRQDKLKLHMDRHRLRELGGKMTLGRPRKEKLTSPSNAQPANHAAPKNSDDNHNSDSEPPSSLPTTPTSSNCSTTPLSTTAPLTGGELGMGQFAFPGTPASSARPSSSSSPSPLSSGLTSPSSLSGSMPYNEMSYLSLLTLSQRGLGLSSSDLSSSSSVLPHLLHHHQALQLYQKGLKASMSKRGPNSRNQQVNNGARSKGLTTHESAAESLLSLVQQMGEAQTLPPPAHS